MSKSFFWANVQKFWRLIFKAVKFPWYFCRYVILYQFAYISFNKAKLGIKAPKNLQLAIAALEKAAQISRRWNLERDISKNIMNQNDNQWRLIFKAIKLCWYLLVSITIYSQGIVRIKMANLGIDRSDNFQLAIAALEEAAQIQRHLQLAISVSKKIFDQSARIDKSFGLAEEHLSATLNELGSAYVTQAELGIDSANNLQLAIAALQESEEITRGLGLERDLSDTLNNLGNGYVRQADLGIDSANNLQLAIAAYGESAEIMRGLGLERELSATLNNLSLAYINQAKLGIDSANNLQLAIAALQESEEIRRRLGLERELSATLNNLGNGYVRQAELGIDSTNNLQLAIAALQESAEITRGLGLETDLSDTLNNLGSAYVTQAELGIDSANNLQLAIATLQESEEITRGLGLERDLSATLMNLGSAYVNQAELGIDSTNNLQLAIAALQESEEITRGLGLERDLSDTLNNLSLAYINQAKLGIDSANNLQLTIAALQESEEIRRRLGLERDLSGTLMNLGSAYIKQAELGMDSANNLQLAIAALQESKEIKRRLGLERDLSTTLNNLGFAYVTQAGDLQAIAAYREAGYTAKELYNAITNSLQAIAAYREALTYQNPTILPVDVLRTARNLGNLGFNQGDWHVALEGYQIAMTAIDYSRTQRTNQAERDKIVAESIGIYENAIQAAINLNDIATALKIVERVRAKRLVDLMATADLYQDGNIPPQIKQRLQQLDDLDN
ncbi:hypothetical protein [Sphaerospermopsis torques-reginae]|uniref:Uncharacterized protein n=1 Tax=Sphaerospermopsis torques-reginae ITEP-024 TaxID=984208 RepID=A0ABX8WVR2_9CYAN|nr:hypothetical protein [Sphaerospermopsis torques-reginae]QYX30524.1 hypothetical protein K2F26_16700 [Sphaerospermopsis torques-reginae ITEP-024]